MRRTPARPRGEEIRQFATVVGCVLIGYTLVASGLHSWRAPGLGWTVRRPWVGGLGVGVLALGYLAPRTLDLPERLWMRLARFMGYWNTRLLLSLFFFLAVTPMGLVLRLLGRDGLGLRRRRDASSYFEPAPESLRDPGHFERPY